MSLENVPEVRPQRSWAELQTALNHGSLFDYRVAWTENECEPGILQDRCAGFAKQIGHGPIMGCLPYVSATGPSVTEVSVSVTVRVMVLPEIEPTKRAGWNTPRSTGYAVTSCSPRTLNAPFSSMIA